MSEIKNCPFCGGVADIWTRSAYSFVECEQCEAEGPPAAEASDAIDAWNSRATPSGYALVPVEPTEEMLKLGSRAYWDKQRDMCSPTPTEFPDECGGPMGYAYLAMVAAAQQGGERGAG